MSGERAPDRGPVAARRPDPERPDPERPAPERADPERPGLQPFDLAGPLPTRTTVLEASAGTGKTWTIAGLVTRYVAEGHARLDEVLAVTFGRAATAELRTRVRERLRDTRDALADPAAARAATDPVVVLLATGAPAEVEARRARLEQAVAGFDAATVATTHEFCHRVLHALGTAADLDPGTLLVESTADVLADVCDDLHLRFATTVGDFPLSRAETLALARAAVGDASALLLPTEAPADGPADLAVRFARAARAETARRLRAARVVGFDDLLTRVRDALADPVSGPVARQRLRDRWRVVLVDEFQDTDPVQWEVLRLAFHGSRDLVVIGDPKQAIYAFRGADVRAYLAASAEAHTRTGLPTNWRSDPRLLDGLATLFRGAALGDRGIVVRPVAAGHRAAALGPDDDPAPVRVRVLRREGLPVWKGLATVAAARRRTADDLAAEVVALLGAGHTVTPRDAGAPARPLEARDVAVLVRTGTQAQTIREALQRVGVPSVLTGTSSVFATRAAADWLLLLEALEQPHRSGRVRRLALSPLVGLTGADIDGDEGRRRTDELAATLRDWSVLLTERGVAALQAAVDTHLRLPERLLRRPDGERLLTDLRHVGEALHAQAVDEQLGLAGLVGWLRGRTEEAATDVAQERSRRLDTDAAAVQVVTVHTSKGLEFPVVLVPYAWDAVGGGDRTRLPRGHDPGGQRTLFVGGKDDPGYAAACAAEDVEEAGEELRLLYVAATRAVSRLVLWWAATTKTAGSPLHRLLAADDPAAGVPATAAVPTDRDVLDRVAALAGAGRGLAVEVVPAPGSAETPAAAPAGGDAPVLSAAVLDRPLDAAWRRTSYTALTRDVHDGPGAGAVGSEPDVAAKDDEVDAPAPTPEPDDAADDADHPLRAVPSPMADLPGGTAFGTLVHAVLEHAEVDGPDPLGALRAAAAEQLAGGGSTTPDALAAALLPAVSTPLGPLAGGRALRDVPRRDLLPELDFELPLVGGDRPRGEDLRLGSLAGLLRRHLPADDPVAPYADALAAPALADQPLRGYLAGSLDAVLRVDGRYVVVDHKTNRLADRDEVLTAWHYRREALDAAVLRAHYPLQALLYAVALHRFLRWRQRGYDPAEHLGGVLYLFLRGMCGSGVDAGVWSWHPPAGLVTELSDTLAGPPATTTPGRR